MFSYTGHTAAEEEEDEDPTVYKGKQSRQLPFHGNRQTMNLNPLILTNIQGSPYYKVELFRKKTFHEVVDEIYYKVEHLEPWERGSRGGSGMRTTGMCGGVRGVSAGGVVSSAFCLLYKLFTLKLTENQVTCLINHRDSPYIRGLGFMYLRFTQPPADIWDWFEPYMEDEEQIDVKAGGGKTMAMGNFLKLMMTKLEWFDTRFPRIPVNVEKMMRARIDEMSGLRGGGVERNQGNEEHSQEVNTRENTDSERKANRRSRSQSRGYEKSKGDRSTETTCSRYQSREKDRYKDKDCKRDKDRSQDQSREKDRYKDKDCKREKDRSRDRSREKNRSKDKDCKREKDGSRDRSREKDKYKDKGRKREKDRSRDRSQEKYRSKDKDGKWEKDRSRDQSRERNRSKEKDRKREKNRSRSHDRNKKAKSKGDHFGSGDNGKGRGLDDHSEIADQLKRFKKLKRRERRSRSRS